jgi:hypothetical protein
VRWQLVAKILSLARWEIVVMQPEYRRKLVCVGLLAFILALTVEIGLILVITESTHASSTYLWKLRDPDNVRIINRTSNFGTQVCTVASDFDDVVGLTVGQTLYCGSGDVTCVYYREIKNKKYRAYGWVFARSSNGWCAKWTGSDPELTGKCGINQNRPHYASISFNTYWYKPSMLQDPDQKQFSASHEMGHFAGLRHYYPCQSARLMRTAFGCYSSVTRLTAAEESLLEVLYR